MDVWEPTLDQINKRTYDYVKLHRISACFDVGIAPFSMGMCFDGTLLLPALPIYQDRSNALAQFNGILTELLLGGLYCEAVTPNDIGLGSLSVTSYARIDAGTGPSVSFHRAARSTYVGSLEVIGLLKPETISVDALQKCLKSGRDLIAKLGNIPREQVLYGTTFYVRNQWAESLVHIWTITERIVEIAWQKHVVGSVEEPSKRRRDFLDDNRTWPISTKLEVLFQKHLLPAKTYDTLEEVRKARNDFAHGAVLPTHDVAAKALKGCFELASLCASEFRQTTLFEKVVSLVLARSKPELISKEKECDKSEISHWLALPPLPGDKAWGDRAYEIVEEFRLEPLEVMKPTGSHLNKEADRVTS